MSEPIDLRSLKRVGEGSYGIVYMLEPTKVVKVFWSGYSKRKQKLLLKDEIEGSKRPGALPVLETIKVLETDGTETEGLVKKFIPHKLSEEEFDAFLTHRLHRTFDDRCCNYRKDEDGTIYKIDTQTEAITMIDV